MKDWNEESLGRMARIRRGASPRPIDDPRWFALHGPGWVRIADVSRANGGLRKTEQCLSAEGARRSVRVGPGDVIMSICATIGQPIAVEMDACIHDGFVVFDEFESELDRSFFLHLLRAIAPKLRSQGQTGTQANLNTDIVNRFRVSVPASTVEQARIAAVLDAVEAAIAKTKAVIAKLKLVRAGLLHDLLTRGIDHNGELRDPAAHPEHFKESPLGRIPKDWAVLPVERAGEVRLGRQRSPAYEVGRHIRPYLRVANVFDGFIDYSDVLSMNFDPCEQQTYGLLPGDILLNEGQSLELVGRSAVFQGAAGVYCFQNTLVRFRCRGEAIPEFCQAVFKQWLETRRFASVARQTTSVAHLGADRFAQMPFPSPPLTEQKVIAACLHTHRGRQACEEALLRGLENVKSGLTADLLSGRVRVPADVDTGGA